MSPPYAMEIASDQPQVDVSAQSSRAYKPMSVAPTAAVVTKAAVIRLRVHR